VYYEGDQIIMKNKIVLALCAVSVMSVLLVGCGSSSEQEAVNQPTVTEAAPIEDAAGEVTAEPTEAPAEEDQNTDDTENAEDTENAGADENAEETGEGETAEDTENADDETAENAENAEEAENSEDTENTEVTE